MKPLKISDFLDRYQSIQNPKAQKKDVLSLIVSGLGLDPTFFSESDIEVLIKGSSLVICGPDVVKHKIFIKQEPLLKEINKIFPELGIKKIVWA